MTPESALDHQVLLELRPPTGAPQSVNDLVISMSSLRRGGSVVLPAISTLTVESSLYRLQAAGKATPVNGRWEFTPANLVRQKTMF
jgi:hypothetical protein